MWFLNSIAKASGAVARILTSLRTDRKNIVPDLVAGATFAIVNVPQGMANAVLAAVNPVAGLYALMVAMPVGALATSSVFMNVSTTGALSVAAGEAMSAYQPDKRAAAMIGLVLMIGLIQLTFGILRLGRLVRFVSNAVMTGFITGIAILIMLGAVPDITGYSSAQANHILRLADTALNWRRLDQQTLFIGFATIALIIAFQRTRARRFALIIALGMATALTQLIFSVLGPGTAPLVGDVADIPRSLPLPQFPDYSSLPNLLLPAFAIAVIGLIQGAGVGQSYPNPDGRFPETSGDFIGQGVANIAAASFGAIPSGGSMSGTAVTVQSGARTRWANIFAGAFVVAIIFLFANVVRLVPMAGLGGLLVVVGFQNLQPETIRSVWVTGWMARLSMAGTTLATLLMPLQFAILVGIALSFVLQILHLANKVELRELQLVEGGFPIDVRATRTLRPGEIKVLSIRGSLFFASAQALESQLPDTADARGATVILILRGINDLGSTVIRLLKRYAMTLQKDGGALVLTGVDEELFAQLQRTGLVDQLGSESIYMARPEIGAALNEAIVHARRRLD